MLGGPTLGRAIRTAFKDAGNLARNVAKADVASKAPARVASKAEKFRSAKRKAGR